jgi:hypothetical protein
MALLQARYSAAAATGPTVVVRRDQRHQYHGRNPMKTARLVLPLAVAGSVLVPVSAQASPGHPDHAAVVRVADGHLTWLIRSGPGGGNADVVFTYGIAGDIPVWGDWNNDGVKTPGVFRDGTWLLKDTRSGGNADRQVSYGRTGDIPVVGDWDGTGGPGLGVVRGTTWLLKQGIATGNADVQFGYGSATDVPVVGDWDNNGSDTPGVFRNGMWLLKNSLSSGNADREVSYGRAGDVPMTGDWAGTGHTGLGVRRATTWLLRNDTNGGNATTQFAYGTATDTPVYTAQRPGSPGPAPSVTGIDWSRFTRPAPTDADSARMTAILRNALRYGLTTWWQAKGFAASTDPYLNFGGTGEAQVRAPANEAMAIAIALRTGAYDPASVGGITAAEATRRATRLASSLAYRHASNSTGGWGDAWQSALWTAYGGFAGWLMWDDLSAADRALVARMVEHEADRFIGYTVPYYRNPAGTITSPGNTFAEENAWNAMVLQLATAMMPNHPRRASWMDKNLELMVSAFARPSDVSRTTVVDGKAVRDWLRGSNIDEDGVVVNHNRAHPDYSTTVSENTQAALVYSLAGQTTPRAALWNADVVYDALVDRNWVAGSTFPPGGTVLAPGGTVYVDGSEHMYYPQGNDWGTARRIQPTLLDVQAAAFGFDRLASTRAPVWERLHGQRVLDMQRRSTDGRTYQAAAEDVYVGREELVAATAAQAWLTKWVVAQDAYRLAP